jgi:hypothetical protein
MEEETQLQLLVRGTKRNSIETACARWEINMRERVVICFGDTVSTVNRISHMNMELSLLLMFCILLVKY